MEQLNYIGKRVPRKDGPDKVTGRAKYTVDIQLPGMLVGKILRSPLPHAKILNIDISKAKKLTGVKAIITAADTLMIKHGFVETPRYPPDQYPLAVDKVRYCGEEVAAVAAIDEYTAMEAVDLIKIDYEPLPAVFDPEKAMEESAVEIHLSHPKVTDPYKNIAGKTASAWGDVEKGFADSDLIREDHFESHLRTHCYMEPQATVASYDFAGKLNLWTSSQGPFLKRLKLSKVLGIPCSNVRVLKAYVGGGFGGKVDLFSHEFCASLLSIKTIKPVKIVIPREEIFTCYRHGQPLTVQIKTGVRKDGTLMAQQFRVINNCGAYRGTGVVVIFLAWGFAMLPYRIPNLKYEAYSVYTNNAPRTAQRGHGAPQMRFAVESQMDLIAEKLGIDPIEIRLKNARLSNEELPNGDNTREYGLYECIKSAAEKSDFLDKYKKSKTRQKVSSKIKRGIGIGVSSYFTGSLIYPNSSSLIIKMNDDGSASLITGSLDIGQGCETILTQIAAEELSIPPDKIQVVAADTETTPVDIGSWISGNAYVSGNACKKAAEMVRNKLFEIVAEELEANINDLALRDQHIFVKGSPDTKISFEKAVALNIWKRDGDPIIGEGHFRTVKDVRFHPSLGTTKGRWSENYAAGAQVAEVEVDIETGKIRLVKAITAHDCGFAINPLLVEGQIDVQVSMAFGHACLEEVMTKEGRVLNPNFLEYRLPCAMNVAEAEYVDVITEKYTSDSPYRTKEVGEGYVSGILAAIANAIYNAVAIKLYSTPFTPEKVLRALKDQNQALT